MSVSVKQFGAVGDGVTNDTAAIVDAIRKAAANGNGLIFAAGQYLVDPIAITGANVPRWIDGQNATLLARSAADVALTIENPHIASRQFFLRNIHVDSRNLCKTGILIHGSQGCAYENLLIQNSVVSDLVVMGDSGSHGAGRGVYYSKIHARCLSAGIKIISPNNDFRVNCNDYTLFSESSVGDGLLMQSCNTGRLFGSFENSKLSAMHFAGCRSIHGTTFIENYVDYGVSLEGTQNFGITMQGRISNDGSGRSNVAFTNGVPLPNGNMLAWQ